MRLPDRQQADRDVAVADLAEALRTFTVLLTEAQRQQLLFALDSPQRTTSRDPTLTPAFCAVLAWCVPGWGLSLGTLSFEQRMAFEAFLRAALGPTGYENSRAVPRFSTLSGLWSTPPIPRRSPPPRPWRPDAALPTSRPWRKRCGPVASLATGGARGRVHRRPQSRR